MDLPKTLFKRKLYSRLLRWKAQEGKTAVLIEGARRVGKSVLAESFAENEYASHILIDFSKASRSVIELFNDVNDLDVFFQRLQLEYGTKLVKRESVIIFDEVQFCPKARAAIKHLVADRRYDYMETGSLLSIKKNVQGILIPSEESRLPLHPLDFEEFKWAFGDCAVPDLLREWTRNPRKKPFSEPIARKLMRDFRQYMLCGGMPQAVAALLETNNWEEVDEAKRNILSLYADDLRKIDSTGRVSAIFMSIPSQLARHTSSYHPRSVLGKGVSAPRIKEMIAELESSKTVNFCHDALDPDNQFGWGFNIEKYKLYLADTGLFVTLGFLEKRFADNPLYRKLLADKLHGNLGFLYENIVAQMLTATGRRLYYHTFPTSDGRHKYEIDFLLSSENKTVPLEVKSSSYKTHASLDAFLEKHRHEVKDPLVVVTKDYHREGNLSYVPVFTLPFWVEGLH